MSAISIENLSKTYPPNFPRLKKFFGLQIKDEIEALQNVSLEIGDGEIFGLIGKNGAGKTTLTKIIATLVQPTSGKVSVKGFDSIDDEVKVRSLIGLATAEERSFYWRLSCERNMLFFARLYAMDDKSAKKRIGEIFDRLNLNELKSRRFSELSTGNKQKLAVARALLPSPPILLLDEPTRSLDPMAGAEMRTLIASLENVSVLLTSHNLAEIEELCNRVAIISKGEIRAVDSPENLRRKNKTVQTVKIYLSRMDENGLRGILSNFLTDYSIECERDYLKLIFEREPEDEILGKTISKLTEKGAKIIDVETEKATLLDVLESYD
ncbi:daunorubicin resistance protein DrrA family ABC transporter ATP-binding protein [soil metagenome]